MIPAVAFKTALLDHLLADSAVAALAGARVYDEAPRDERGDPADAVASPWLYLDRLSAQRLETGCGPEWTVTAILVAASTAAGRAEAWALADAVAAACEELVLTLAAPAFMAQACFVSRAEDSGAAMSPHRVALQISAILGQN